MKRKKLLIVITTAVVVLLGVVLASPFVAVGYGGFENAGSTLSIAFDKHKIKAVDRVVLQIGQSSVEICDQELIEQLKSELVVAKRTDLKVYYPNYGKYIMFYKGDDLVRCMRWGGEDKSAWVEVYKEDASHIIMFSTGNEGLVCLSEETLNALNRFIDIVDY